MTTFGDQVYQYGGMPVGSNAFAGWWDNDVWFVDFDNGTRTSQQGKDNMKAPQKDLYQSVQDAGPNDTIFIRPRTTVGTQATNQVPITPAASEAANWAIPQTAHHLSIIGTTIGGGLTHGVHFQSYASLTTPTIQVLAPFVTFENVGFIGIASQVNSGLLGVQGGIPGTYDGFACVVDNCNFQVYKSSFGGACSFDSSRYNRLLNSYFWHNYVSVELASTYGNIQGNEIKGCTFLGATTDIDCDILIADATHVLIDDNLFDHAQPAYASGVRLLYVQVVGTAAGMFSNNTLATTEATIGTAASLSNIVDVGNKCGADLVWMTNA